MAMHGGYERGETQAWRLVRQGVGAKWSFTLVLAAVGDAGRASTAVQAARWMFGV